MISVIIPTYCPGEYIKECIDSLEKQTLAKNNFEVIIVLNGERDPHYDNIMSITEGTGLDLYLIHTEEKGVSKARNIGLDNARGEFMAFIDDDDYVSPQYLESMYEIAKTGIMPISNRIGFEDTSRDIVPNYMDKIFQKNMQKNRCVSIMDIRPFVSSACYKLIPVSAIEGRRFNHRYKNGEDSLFMAVISDNIKKIRLVPDAIYYRRYRENSAYTSKKSRRYLLSNNFRLMGEYISLPLCHPTRYNLPFILTRILASGRNIIHALLP